MSCLALFSPVCATPLTARCRAGRGTTTRLFSLFSLFSLPGPTVMRERGRAGARRASDLHMPDQAKQPPVAPRRAAPDAGPRLERPALRSAKQQAKQRAVRPRQYTVSHDPTHDERTSK